MKTKIVILALIIFSCGTSEKEEWIQLFNGKDLTGWDIKIRGSELNENYKNTFRVEDGLLKVNYDEWDQFNGEFGHIFYKEKYSHYKLRIEYRFVGEQVPGGPGWAIKNSGAMLHSQSAQSMGVDQDFPVSIEAQFLGGFNEDERPTNNLCTPGTYVVMNNELVTRHCTNSTSKTFFGEEWVNVELVVLGDSIIHHLVEGDTVLTYSKPQIGGGSLPVDYPVPEGTPLKEGYISLQAESHPIEFRKVELLELK
jgi:hypothetical protein